MKSCSPTEGYQPFGGTCPPSTLSVPKFLFGPKVHAFPITVSAQYHTQNEKWFTVRTEVLDDDVTVRATSVIRWRINPLRIEYNTLIWNEILTSSAVPDSLFVSAEHCFIIKQHNDIKLREPINLIFLPGIISDFRNKALSAVYKIYKLTGCVSRNVVGRLQRQWHYETYRCRDMQSLHTWRLRRLDLVLLYSPADWWPWQ